MEAAVGYEKELKSHIERERAAVKLGSKVGELLYDKGIELVLFRNHLLDVTISEVLNLHEYARKVVNKPIDVFTTSELASEIYSMHLAPAKLDIGKLATEWIAEQANFKNKRAFLDSKLAGFDFVTAGGLEPRDVVLYGFGRIGRLAARELIKQAGKGQQLRLRAIVTRGATDKDIIKRASLLRTDSVHGAFKGTVEPDLERRALIINGQVVQMIDDSNPEDIDYTAYGIDNEFVIDNNGVFKSAFVVHYAAVDVIKAHGRPVCSTDFGHFKHDYFEGLNATGCSCAINSVESLQRLRSLSSRKNGLSNRSRLFGVDLLTDVNRMRIAVLFEYSFGFPKIS